MKFGAGTFLKSYLLLALLGVSACNEKPATVNSSPSPLRENLSDRIGKSFACSINVWAAYNEEDASRLRELLQTSDKQAVLTMVRRGQLILVRKGTTVTIEGIKAWGAVEMFRARGNPDLLYVPIGLME
jgi:hypothetical protein